MYYKLSTKDNPYNPFKEYDEWWYFDNIERGYHTDALIDRIAETSRSFTDEENDREEEYAIDFIIEHDPLDLYIKVPES